jgi:hypothetical protein
MPFGAVPGQRTGQSLHKTADKLRLKMEFAANKDSERMFSSHLSLSRADDQHGIARVTHDSVGHAS